MTRPTRRDFIRASVAAAASGTLLHGVTGCEPGERESRSPNLLFVFPDQMRAQAEERMNMTPGKQRYTISGLVTTYKGKNYMLLRRAQRTFTNGNFTR